MNNLRLFASFRQYSETKNSFLLLRQVSDTIKILFYYHAKLAVQ